MAGQVPEYGNEPAREYNDRNATIIALVGALLLDAAIIGIFMLITWFGVYTD